MDLISPQQYQALDLYLDCVAQHAKQLHIQDLYARVSFDDSSGWQQEQVEAAKRHKDSEQAKLNAMCSGDFKKLFPDTLISSLLAKKMG